MSAIIPIYMYAVDVSSAVIHDIVHVHVHVYTCTVHALPAFDELV